MSNKVRISAQKGGGSSTGCMESNHQKNGEALCMLKGGDHLIVVI